MRYCKDCDRSRPETAFGRDNQVKDGLARRCLDCMHLYRNSATPIGGYHKRRAAKPPAFSYKPYQYHPPKPSPMVAAVEPSPFLLHHLEALKQQEEMSEPSAPEHSIT